MSIEKLAEEWRQEGGVQEGDMLLIHSDIKRTYKRYRKMGVKLSPGDILDSFLKAVGPSGTLLLPLFNFDFAKGIPFDMRNTPSRMGAISEAARLRPDAVRTGHPIYSFAVIGKEAEKFRGVDNFSGYGEDSPFGMLRRMDGKIAVLDLGEQESMTFHHHIEEMNNVDYRYHKTFTGQYTDLEGNTTTKTYGLFVRDVERGVLTFGHKAGELMWHFGLYKGCKPKEGCGLKTISAREAFDFMSKIMIAGKIKYVLYRIEGEPVKEVSFDEIQRVVE